MDMQRLDNKISTCWINVNRACNLRCSWCYAQSTKFNNKKLLWKDAKKIVDIFSEYGTKSFIILGGEPTLYENLPQLLEYIYLKGGSSTIVTNAIRFSDKQYLINLQKSHLDGIGISVKGYDKKSFINNTGFDGFQKFELAINNLTENGLKYNPSFVISKDSIDYIENVLEYLMRHNVQHISLSFYKQPFGIEGIGDKPQELINKFAEKYEIINKITGGHFSLHQSLPFCLWPKDLIVLMNSRNQLRSLCQLICHNGLVVDVDMNLCVCNMLYDYPIGTINEKMRTGRDLSEFWHNKHTYDIYKSLLRLPSKVCETCEELSYCAGGCVMQYFNYALDDIRRAKNEN
ncbi:radical SAM/SPASM domain-containing protein [Pumilibacter muris]|uniref:radical SAM/SPASM domain-containing protein n=1 Tax=Pumilibacter muris TaxID=2941510 RepID=UPI0020409E79|nr:radical SAM protein [Pumilibacter muris]